MNKEKMNKKSQIKLLGILLALAFLTITVLALNSSEISQTQQNIAGINETNNMAEEDSNEIIVDDGFGDEIIRGGLADCIVLIDGKEVSYEEFLIKKRINEIKEILEDE